MTAPAALGRRLAAYRAAHPGAVAAPTGRRIPSRELADRLAAAVDGEVARRRAGHRRPGRAADGQRARSTGTAWPASPASRRPTRRSSASTRRRPAWARRRARSPSSSASAGGAAIALRAAPAALPDHADEPALLDAVEPALPPDAWLVTYNGRSFDWPLLVTRYRCTGGPRRPSAGISTCCPTCGACSATASTTPGSPPSSASVLGVRRRGRRGRLGDPEPLPRLRARRAGPAARGRRCTHNAEDVGLAGPAPRPPRRALRRPDRRPLAPAGDLVALARAFTRDRRHRRRPRLPRRGRRGLAAADARLRRVAVRGPAPSPATVSRERIRAERARTLRRLGRTDEALAAWEALATGGGSRRPRRAWVEVAKVREHVLRDPAGALRASRGRRPRWRSGADRRWGGDPDFDAALAGAAAARCGVGLPRRAQPGATA